MCVRVEFPEGEEPPGEWTGLVLSKEGAAPIAPEEEVTGEIERHTMEADRLRKIVARRELLALSPLARVGSASSDGAAFLSAYAAVDPDSRCGYLEIWIGDQEEPEVSEFVRAVVSLRALLSGALKEADEEAAELAGLETDTEIPILDQDLLSDFGLDFDCYGDFPTAWNEALERFGDFDDEDDGEDDDDDE